MNYIDETKSAIVIFSGNVARQLLKKGYTIIDVKPDRGNKIKSVFVFNRENDIEQALFDLTHADDNDLFSK